MKKSLISIFAVVLIFNLFSTQSIFAQRYDKGLVDKTIALIGNEMIMLSQLESEVQMMAAQGIATDANTRCEVLENMLVHRLMLNQARLDSLVVSPEMVEVELENWVATTSSQLGGEKAMEEYFNSPMHKLKNTRREAMMELNLTQKMQQDIMSKATKATPNLVRKFYKNTDKDSLPIISTQYKLSQIAVYPNKEEAALLVKEQLLELRERILKGEKFSTLATLYSEDPGSALRGGELRMASKNIYWPAFSDAAMALKEGQVSQIVETPDGFHILQMVEKDGDMFNVRHILIAPKYTSADREVAFKRLDSIRNKIIGDSITFQMAARFYSEDIKSALNGGQIADANSGSILFDKDQLKPMDYNVLKDMEIGEISNPVESLDNEGREGQKIYKILKLDALIPSHVANLEQDYMVIQDIANRSMQQEAINKFVKEKMAITFIRIDDLFKDCNFERKGWIK